MATRHCRVRFKEVKHFPGYFVGSDGSVWSSWVRDYPKGVFGKGARWVQGGKWQQMRLRALGKYGYRQVQLRRGGKYHHLLVSRLVLFAFRGAPPQGGMEAAHEDNDRGNN